MPNSSACIPLPMQCSWPDASTDALHGQLSGAGTKKICERMYHVHAEIRYERLAGISVSHLYNLRHSIGYRRQRRQFNKTRPVRSQIDPQGQPGFLRASIRVTWMGSKGSITSTSSSACSRSTSVRLCLHLDHVSLYNSGVSCRTTARNTSTESSLRCSRNCASS